MLSLEDCLEAKKSITLFFPFQCKEIEHPVQCFGRDEVPSGEDDSSTMLLSGLANYNLSLVFFLTGLRGWFAVFPEVVCASNLSHPWEQTGIKYKKKCHLHTSP